MTSNTQIHDRSLSRHDTGISIKSGGVERSKIDTPNKQIHDRSLFWHGTGTSIKSGGIKLFFGPKHILLVKRSCQSFPHVSGVSTNY